MTAKITIAGLLISDENVFSDLVLPEGLDRDLVIDTIVEKCMMFEVLYPDPEFMRKMINVWSKGCLEVWEHLNKTLHYEYNPIWNKDGKYVEERVLNTSSSAENTGQVAAFNSSAFQNATHATGSGKGSEGEKITRTEQGNIGVTTTQQMIKEEREIAEFNIYTYIADDYKNRFCLLVY